MTAPRSKQKGFTLIEIIVVLAILALMAVVTLVAINPVERMRRGRDARRLSDLTQIRKAIDHYLVGDNKLPINTSGSLRNSGVGTIDPGNAEENWIRLDLSASLPALPFDPAENTAASFAEDPPQQEYFYYYR